MVVIIFSTNSVAFMFLKLILLSSLIGFR